MNKINVINIVNTEYCIDPERGNRLYHVILEYYQERKPVEVSFEGIKIICTHFIDSSISLCYNPDVFDIKWFDNNVKYVFDTEYQEELVQKCINNAKKWYAERSNKE